MIKMSWETGDGLSVPNIGMMRSLSTSTPLVSARDGGKLFRSHSVGVYTSNDSGLGDSFLNTSETDTFNTPDSAFSLKSDFNTAIKLSTCPTPKTTVLDTTYGRRQLEYSFSPVVFKPKNSTKEKRLNSDFVFEDNHDITLSEESARYFSQLNLDSGCEVSMETDDVMPEPRLNIKFDSDSPLPHASSQNVERISPVLQTKRASSSENLVDISPEFKDYLQQFLPDVKDRLIGANMARDQIDILEELHVRGMSQILSVIFGYLDNQDLTSVYDVSVSWRTMLEANKQTSKRRREFLKKRRKPEFLGKENLRKKSTTSRCVAAAGPLQVLGNLQLQNQVTEDTPERQTTRLDLFVEASKGLKSDEHLQKCPRCSKPAKVLPVQERGICLQADCAFDYCINCYNKFHRSLPCVRSPQKRSKTDAVGHKKSKKNLKRL